MNKTKLPKGQHEEEVELVKNMLEERRGLIEIMNSTSLNEEEVVNINDKFRGKI